MTSPPNPQAATTAAPPKAIPPTRDQLQSRLLVWIILPVLCFLALRQAQFLLRFLAVMHGTLSPHGLVRGYFLGSQGRYVNSVAQSAAASVLFGLLAWRLRAATSMAAVCGSIICFLVSNCSTGANPSIIASGLAPLLLLFILTFYATRLGREKKATAGLAESRRGRNAAQVIANLGIAAFFTPMLCYSIALCCGWEGEYVGELDAAARAYFAIPFLPMLAALAEATADTVSSEVGQAFGGIPFMLTTLRRVPPGTDGAITLTGTLAGVTAAALIAATGAPALGMSPTQCLVAFAAGVAGLFFDSLLGATLERRGYIGNDLVNFFSTAFAAAVALLAIHFGQGRFFR